MTINVNLLLVEYIFEEVWSFPQRDISIFRRCDNQIRVCVDMIWDWSASIFEKLTDSLNMVAFFQILVNLFVVFRDSILW